MQGHSVTPVSPIVYFLVRYSHNNSVFDPHITITYESWATNHSINTMTVYDTVGIYRVKVLVWLEYLGS